MVALEVVNGTPTDEFLDLSELTSPGILFMQNICPDDFGSAANHNEVQIVTIIDVTAGTFVLEFDGQPTAAIEWDASAEDVQDAL